MIWSTVSILMVLSGCSAPTFLTATVDEGDRHVVRLQAIPGANQGRGFSHPATIPPHTLERVLKGLVVEEPMSLIPLAFGGGASVRRTAAFGDAEAKFLAPLLAEGLDMATPEELVTFYETADISATQRVVTSGGVFVRGEQLHVVLSNHLTKVDIWQDNEQYEAPYRLRPMEPIDAGPGRLLFEPSRHMVTPDHSGFGGVMKGRGLHIAVRYRALPSPDDADDPAHPAP